jgi:type IV pilus assembly protein PilA
MIDRIRNRMESEEGFTLIELLVVILIIGILAAIAIPSFLNQREKGQDACAKSQARTMATAMETYYTDMNTYAGATMGSLTAIESAVTATGACGSGTTAAMGLAVVAGTGLCNNTATTADSYCVSQSSATGAGFNISKTSGAAAVRACGPAARQGKGGCPSGGSW